MAPFKKITYIFVTLFLLVNCSKEIQDRTWTVPLQDIPSSISVDRAVYDKVAMILKLTHQPLFYLDGSRGYRSKILSSWAKSIDGLNYNFCLEGNSNFDDNLKYTVTDLTKLIKKLLHIENYSYQSMDLSQANCLGLKLKHRFSNLIKLLSLYKYAPTIEKKDKYSKGLGQFYISKMAADYISLIRKTPHRKAYNKIEFISTLSIEQGKVDHSSVEDYNFTPLHLRPNWLKQRYTKFEFTQLKSTVLAINSLDQLVREAIFSCAEIDLVIKSTIEQGSYSRYPPLVSILPVGVRGGKRGFPIQKCKPLPSGYKHKTLYWVFYKSRLRQTFLSQVSRLSKLSGVSIKPVMVDAKTAVQKLFAKDYGLFVLFLDSLDESHLPFFDAFYSSKHKIIQSNDLVGKNIYLNLAKSSNDESRIKYVFQLLRHFSVQFHALPLFQVVRTLYYPKYVTNISVGSDLSDFPNIAEIRGIW